MEIRVSNLILDIKFGVKLKQDNQKIKLSLLQKKKKKEEDKVVQIIWIKKFSTIILWNLTRNIVGCMYFFLFVKKKKFGSIWYVQVWQEQFIQLFLITTKILA